MSDPRRGRTVISTTPGSALDPRGSDVERSRSASQRRFWVLLVVALVLGAGGAIVGVLWLDRRDDSTPAATTAVATSSTSAPALAEPGFAATLTFDGSATVAAAAPGTLTAAPVAAGQPIVRGDLIAEVDGRPVIALYGDEPFTRALAAGDIGSDVTQLEANLVALGFDPDRRITVDDRFTAATADAVAAWEQTYDLSRSGRVPLGRAVVIAGPMNAAEVTEPGAAVQAGTPLVTGPLWRTVTDLVQPWGGTVGELLQPDTPIATGDVLLVVDDVPVVAVTGTPELLSPVLDPLATGDVEMLESALVFFGQDPDGQIVVDGEADLATLAALGRWQVAAGLAETIAPGSVHLLGVPEGHVIDRVFVESGATVDDGVLVYSVGATTAIVDAAVPVDDAGAFAVGDRVQVVLAEGTAIDATVTAIAEPSTGDAASSEPSTVAVTVRLDGDPGATAAGAVTLLPPP